MKVANKNCHLMDASSEQGSRKGSRWQAGQTGSLLRSPRHASQLHKERLYPRTTEVLQGTTVTQRPGNNSPTRKGQETDLQPLRTPAGRLVPTSAFKAANAVRCPAPWEQGWCLSSTLVHYSSLLVAAHLPPNTRSASLETNSRLRRAEWNIPLYFLFMEISHIKAVFKGKRITREI